MKTRIETNVYTYVITHLMSIKTASMKTRIETYACVKTYSNWFSGIKTASMKTRIETICYVIRKDFCLSCIKTASMKTRIETSL